MNIRKRKRKSGLDWLRRYGAILALYLLVAVASLHILQNELLKNAQQMGSALARSYAVEEERNMTAYEALLQVAATRLARYEREGGGEEQVRSWLAGYFADITTLLGDQVVDPYAVVDGKILAANAWEGDDTYDFSSTGWYHEALTADGAVVYTDVYTDAIYQKDVITLAVKSGEGSNVIAFDIFPENFRIFSSSVELPQGSSYFLCDGSGNLLYSQTEMKESREKIQAYLTSVLQKLDSGALDRPNSYVTDLEGRKRGVYFSVADNGWVSLVTVPYETILGDLRLFTLGFSAVFLVFLLVTLGMSAWNYRLNRRVERSNETVRALGNSYYAIYRIDYVNGTYDMTKGSEYLRQRLPKQGNYQNFLAVAAEVIEESACREFMESFSLENIRTQVQKQARDYGGDFLRRFGQEYRWVNVRMLFDQSLDPGEVVMCFREIEAEKQAQLQQLRLLENALDGAKEKEESQNTFFSSMSHDMRTPLNAIIGLSQLASENTQDPERTREYLKKINLSSHQLLGLINDILELSRLRRGKIDLNRAPFRLEECLRECAETFQHQAQQEEKTFQLTFELQDTTVLGDEPRMVQIFNNLLSNAVKFSNPGDTISFKARQMEGGRYAKYQFVVSDTGRGMSKGFLEKLFEPYEREVRFGERNVSGTGLGMPIVKSLVAQMDGQITVESELGKGTTFIVTLPLEVVGDQEQTALKPACPTEEGGGLSGKRVLLAEDNEVNLEIATELLSMHGVEVIQAQNGLEAVAQFEASSPGFFDAVLLDMQMPELDGCGAARAIRAMDRPDAAAVPILAVTANAFAEDIAATTEAGMDAHISKPIDFQVLCQTLVKLIGRREKEPPAQG